MRFLFLILVFSFNSVIYGQQLNTPIQYFKPFYQALNIQSNQKCQVPWQVAIKSKTIQFYKDSNLLEAVNRHGFEYGDRFYVVEEAENKLKIRTLDNSQVVWCKKSDLLLSSKNALSSSEDYTLIKVLIPPGSYEVHPTRSPDSQLSNSFTLTELGVFHLLERDESNNWILINDSPKMSSKAVWIKFADEVKILKSSLGYESENVTDFLYGGYPIVGQDEQEYLNSVPSDVSQLDSAVMMTSWEINRIISKMESIIELNDGSKIMQMCIELGARQDWNFIDFFQKYLIDIRIFNSNVKPSELRISDLQYLDDQQLNNLIQFCQYIVKDLGEIDFQGKYEVSWVPLNLFNKNKTYLQLKDTSNDQKVNKFKIDRVTVLYLERPEAGKSKELTSIYNRDNLLKLMSSILKEHTQELLIVYTCTSNSNLCSSIAKLDNLESVVNEITGRNDRLSIDWRLRQKVKVTFREYIYPLIEKHSSLQNLDIYLLPNDDFVINRSRVIGISDHRKLIGDFYDEMSNYVKGELRFYLTGRQAEVFQRQYGSKIVKLEFD